MKKTLLLIAAMAIAATLQAQDGEIYLGAGVYAKTVRTIGDLKQTQPCGCSLADVAENGCTTPRPLYSTDGYGNETMVYRGEVLNRRGGYLMSALYMVADVPYLVLRDPGSPYQVSTRADQLTANRIHRQPDNDGTYIAAYTGSGSPEGVVAAKPGSMYINQGGGAGVTLWVKETGTGATGWAAK